MTVEQYRIGYVPAWLESIIGVREREILQHPEGRIYQVDNDGNRLPTHQQWIESPVGTMWIDSKMKKIIG